MPRVVFDTNIFISALITPGGRGETAYRQAIEGAFELYSSVPILTETAGKLTNKFGWSNDRVTAAVRHIAATATVIKPAVRVSILADEPDNRILECAVAAQAEFIVTGDKHLLALENYEGIAILTLAEFLGMRV
ncbi:MAG: putative toxin-antitoxin system toxin component, PIN family [Nitrospirae bacterium]|nr:putative toxin-antitoxin system toxin component, PIN family [Nitrospirota bacterium]